MSSNKPLQPHHGEIPHHDAAPVTPMEAFLEKNFRKMIIAAVVGIGVASVAGLIRYKTGVTEQAAGEALSSAKTVEDCDLVVQKYPGSSAAGNALLAKADLLWKANKKDSALGVLRDFTKSYTKHPFFLSGLMGLASKLEASGDKAEAKSIYERVAGEFSKSEFAPLAQVRLGDLMWADGKSDDAKKHFLQLPSKYPGELTTELTQTRIDLIDAGLPTKEVDGPPKPKTEPKPVGAAATSAPIEITPNGAKPIKLDIGKGGPPGGVSVPVTVTPQGGTPTPVKTPSLQLKSDKTPVPAPKPGDLKMLTPDDKAPNPLSPASKPQLKIGPPTEQKGATPSLKVTPAPASPASVPASPPAKPAASTKPATPPAPDSKPAGDAAK